MSDTPNNRLRRRLLAGATAVLAAGAGIATVARAAPVASPEAAGDDAEILRLVDRFWALDAVMVDWNAGRITGEAGEVANDEWWECLEAMTDIRASTPEGIRAKAGCLLEGLRNTDSGGTADDCVRAFLAELAGRASA